MRCLHCGNENPEPNRFCGMCGASLLTPSAKAAETVSVSAAAPGAAEVVVMPAQASEAAHAAAPRSEASSSISGPSFLGLGDPGPSRTRARKRASLSIDPSSAPGSSLEYLLDEEEPTRHWGIGKILLILIALALAVGFGYLRWKNQGLAWLNAIKKPSAIVQNSPALDTSAPASPPSSAADTPPAAQPSTPPPTTATPSGAPAASVPSDKGGSTPDPTTTSPGASGADTPKPTDAAPPGGTDKAASPPDNASLPDNEPSATKDTSPETPAPATTATEKPRAASKPAAPKPSAASKPVATSDAVIEAHKYLYGRGASQDCDRGMRLLKPAANQGNPKAMVEIGALYSAGLCTPHDLPTAYRWFALALRKDPENTAVQSDLQKLWGEMTQPERQLAIKLTQ